jgi:hypothetical protein
VGLVWFGFENGLTIWFHIGWGSRIRCVCVRIWVEERGLRHFVELVYL